jgi:hypothetical protein
MLIVFSISLVRFVIVPHGDLSTPKYDLSGKPVFYTNIRPFVTPIL